MAYYRSLVRSLNSRPISTTVPTAGSTYTMNSSERAVYFNHAATLATFTVRLPSTGDSGDTVMLKFRSPVTTLSLQDFNGAAIPSAPVTAAVGQAVYMRYVDPTVGWMWW